LVGWMKRRIDMHVDVSADQEAVLEAARLSRLLVDAGCCGNLLFADG